MILLSYAAAGAISAYETTIEDDKSVSGFCTGGHVVQQLTRTRVPNKVARKALPVIAAIWQEQPPFWQLLRQLLVA